SEVHLCADLVHDFSHADWSEGFIRRCSLTPHFDRQFGFIEAHPEQDAEYLVGADRVHLRHRPITGFSFGTHSSAISAVIYNKSAYIRTKEPQSDYFHDIWRANGWDGESDVWRVEFRLKRDALRDFKIEDVCHGIGYAFDLPERLEVIWQYCSVHFLRYVVPTEDTNRTRWETHSAWQAVQHAFFPLVQIDLAPIVRERKRIVNKERLVQQVTGCLITLHAWDKDRHPCDEGDDLSLVLHRYYPNALEYLEKQKKKSFGRLVQKKQRDYHLIAA
ncbi:MAG: hypothetical protein JO202_10370, partial [Ktedonobacteraceae bacterium]|nr:hypothetical protein [Ktedonobacteraceae bacterium]